MTKHTPGPWTIYNHAGTNSGHYDGYLKSDIRAGADLIHIRQSVAGNTFPRLAANVRLIAAAPELLEALRFAILTIEHRDGLRHRLDLFTETERARLRAAIAKAEGRE